MLFNIEEDIGTRVTGYVVPDGFSAVPTIRVCSGGKELVTLEANETREALVHAKRHETGQCGFSVDARVVSNLSDFADLELFDAETGILIYRRPKPGNIKKKLLRIETHIFPLWAIDNAIASRFQYFAHGIENFGRETVTQLFLLTQVDSIYLSGKILYHNFASFIESEFQTIVVLQDPYEELAERLLVLSRIRHVRNALLDMRESVALEPVIAFAECLPFQDDKGLRRSLRRMPADVAALLANPLVRQLTASTPDEMPGGGAVATALDILASSVVVGRRHEADAFLSAFSELLEVEAAEMPLTPRFAKVEPLARMLKESGEVDLILEKDVELYHYIEKAARKTP